MKDKLFCGAAVETITPSASLLPLPRDASSEIRGIITENRVRVLAVSSGDKRILMVATETVSPPSPAKYVPMLSEKTGISPENIFYFATHAHATVVPGRSYGNSGNDVNSKLEQYTAEFERLLLKAADTALASMRPARVGIGYVKSYINVNRNKDYIVRESSGTYVKTGLGFNGEGPIDRTLAVIRFDDMAGVPIAFFINYPCHPVIMHANDCFDGGMGLSGDYPGLVSEYMESRFEGAVAIWSSGAAGDINPIMMNQMYYPDDADGTYKAKSIKGGDADILYLLARRHYDDVLIANDAIGDMSDEIEIKTLVDKCVTPGRTVSCENPSNRVNPGKFTYQDGAEFIIDLQLLQLGDIAILGIDGDLYTSIALRLKSIAPTEKLLLVSHNTHKNKNTETTVPSYIYDDDGIMRGALKSEWSAIKPGYARDELSRVMLNMFKQSK